MHTRTVKKTTEAFSC